MSEERSSGRAVSDGQSSRRIDHGRDRILNLQGARQWSVFVDGIREEISYRKARKFFDRLEGIKGIFIQRNKKYERRFKFGFLRFGEYEKAYNAIRKLNGVRFHGAFLSLKMAKYPPRHVS